MPKLSANLGFLWTELTLPDAIRAAKKAGFSAVECHWPYETDPQEVLTALQDTGLDMLGLNTKRGNVEKGDNGVAAITGREAEARQYIDEAISYATKINCKNIHVMAGFTDRSKEAEQTFVENLQYACSKADQYNMTILIEPLNSRIASDYHLTTLEQALSTLENANQKNLKIMFDCFHLQIMGGDLANRLRENLHQIGHIQFASVPDRLEPDEGEVDYKWLLAQIDKMGWSGFVGAEYKPRSTTDAGLNWMKTII